jgi:hypothetical protein
MVRIPRNELLGLTNVIRVPRDPVKDFGRHNKVRGACE